jgi:hypothetical protein
MAIKRNIVASNNSLQAPRDTAPDVLPSSHVEAEQTDDVRGYRNRYKSDTETTSDKTFKTGAILPQDMTVRLIKEEASNFELFLSIGYSLFMTVWSGFFGAWISSPKESFPASSQIAMWIFLAIAVTFLVMWIIMRRTMHGRSIEMPIELLKSYQTPVNKE